MSRTALIVDDSISMRRLVAVTLKDCGFVVLEGANGQEALDAIKDTAVDLIITDLNMPVMDGITLIKHVRDTPSTKFTPVLMLTTESQEQRKMEGKAAGATGWIVKPFHPDKLKAVIQKVLP